MHQELEIDLDLKKNSIIWDDYQANMKLTDITLAEHVANEEATRAIATNMAKILDTKYHKKHKELFKSTLEMRKSFQYGIKFKTV
eukprot:2962052-Ditylum_brightwellii.AAC.1